MKFKRKEIDVEAMQVPDLRNKTDEVDALVKFLRSESPQPDPAYAFDYVANDITISIAEGCGSGTAVPGDWITKQADGTLSVVTDKDMTKYYARTRDDGYHEKRSSYAG